MCVALSITEVKYIVTSEMAKELLWTEKFIPELGVEQYKFVFFCDSYNAHSFW